MRKKKTSASPQQKKVKLSPAAATETLAPPAIDKWVDKQALIDEFNISERTLYNLRKKKELPFARLGRLVLYNRTKLEEKLRKLSGLVVVITHIIFYSMQDAGMPVDLLG